MISFFKNLSKKVAAPPGSLIHVGDLPATDKTVINIIDYKEKSYHEAQVNTIEQCLSYKDKDSITWIQISGIHDSKVIEKVGNSFKLHHLIQEDIMNTSQRPKCEDFINYIFVVLRIFFVADTSKKIKSEQVSFILGSKYVLSFHESDNNFFNPIKKRICENLGRIRKMGADYLFYSLIDFVIDNFFLVLESMGEDIEDLEEALLDDHAPDILHQIHQVKTILIFLRKSTWPLRELINGLGRKESALITNELEIYMRDLYDHTIHIIDTLDSYRDMVTNMQGIYLSSISNKMNEVMKVLTIFASIFIPLTFIAGLYGMNFDLMPELKWPLGYPLVLIGMGIVAVVMLLFFKSKKWIGKKKNKK